MRLDCRRYSFSERVVNNWNALPAEAVSCTTDNSFKAKNAPLIQHINMDFISPVPCPKDAPLQLNHNIDNHLQLSLNTKAIRRIVGVRWSSSFVSFTRFVPTCGRIPLRALSLWPGHQPCRPRLVYGRRGGGPSPVAPRSRNPPTGRHRDSVLGR